jgi:hypothetical protein
MKQLSSILSVARIAALLLGMLAIGDATVGTVSAGTLPVTRQPLSLSLAEPVHCRPYWHTHRTCVRWRRGVCRDWRVRRHRC